MSYLYSTLFSFFCLNVCAAETPLVDPTMPADFRAKHSVSADVIVPDNPNAPIWILNTTLINPYQKIAIINGQQLFVGDEVNGAEVVKISHQYVKLRYQNELITINLQSSFISKIKSK